MKLRSRILALVAVVLLFVATVAVVRLRAAAPCRNETICRQYAPWHPYYYFYNCDYEPCPQEPM